MSSPTSSPSPIRVAILADFPLSALESGAMGRGAGQGCTWLPQLAIAFEKQTDFEIHWVILDRGVRQTVVSQAMGQWFHRVPAVKFSLDIALNYLPARHVLKQEIRRIRPHVVHAWGAELIYPAALADFAGPTVFSLQGSLTEYQRIGGLPKDWRWRKMVSTEPRFVRSASIVTAESKWASERVRELKPDVDCRIVDYGVHPNFFATPWNPSPDDARVLYVGGGGYRKGVDVLLEALASMPERSWTVRFAGDAELEREIQAARLPKTEYLGMLKWPELLKELSKAWCLAVPTRADTGPTVVKEARVIGLPVVGTAHGGLRDYIRHGENGWIADPLTPENLATGLRTIMKSHATALHMGRQHHASDLQAFDSSLTATKFTSIYRELVTRDLAVRS